jgi:hypothetical protein
MRMHSFIPSEVIAVRVAPQPVLHVMFSFLANSPRGYCPTGKLLHIRRVADRMMDSSLKKPDGRELNND